MFTIPEKIKLFAFDLDGTLYIGEKAITGASELINTLREKYQVVFFTNNSSKTTIEVHEKLCKLGIKCGLNEIYTSSYAAAQYLQENNLNNVYVIGSKSFCQELTEKGIKLTDNDLADHVVVGLDTNFHYNKIAIALTILQKGGRFIACNEDASFPVGKKNRMPACGAMTGALEVSSGRRPDFIVGKPNTYILSKIATDFACDHDNIIVVGDSYESDIQMAKNANIRSILVSNKNIYDKNVLVVKNIVELLTNIKRDVI